MPSLTCTAQYPLVAVPNRMDPRPTRRLSVRHAVDSAQHTYNQGSTSSAQPALVLGSTSSSHPPHPSDTQLAGCVDQGSSLEYEVQQCIGRGKFSQVWVARHRQSNTMVVLKKVQLFEIMDQKARLDCIGEVNMLRSLQHDNIVKCHTSFIEANELCIVLEWAEAGDFAAMLQRRRAASAPFSIEEVMFFFNQLCAALRHMHDRRIMHRDLKPSNVFVTARGHLKVGDLGLSRHFSSKTDAARSVVGTPYYMSPECIRGTPYSFSSDIWSLGCMLYELITLRSPFQKEGLNFYLLGKLITSGEYDPLPPTCPGFLAHLVSCMLQQDPSLRPDIAAVQQYVLGTPSA